jgi:hypothetical protein
LNNRDYIRNREGATPVAPFSKSKKEPPWRDLFSRDCCRPFS